MPSPFTRKFRSLLPGQRSELTIINADGTGRDVIFVADEIIEAPNWHPGGIYLTTTPSFAILIHMMRRTRPDGRRAKLATTGLRPTADKAKDMMLLQQLIEAGVLRAVIDRTYPLSEIAAAHAYVETGTKAGDVIVTIP